MKLKWIICFLLNLIGFLSVAQSLLDKMVTVNFQNIPIEAAIEEISNKEGISFAYTSSILPNGSINYKAENASLHKVLNDIFINTNVRFIVYAGQIILQKSPPLPLKIHLTGEIIDGDTQLPIPYSTIEKKGKGEGSVADQYGRFFMELTREEIKDTLIISSMGYKKIEIIAQSLSENGYHKVYLQPKTFLLPTIDVKPAKYKSIRTGNRGNLVRGSLYIDTYGQQTAIFIENNKNLKGKITEVQFFLSRKGNTGAPFRIRVYRPDSINKPGKDLLPHMVVVKPNGIRNGWFSVDVSEFDIDLPEDGFFVGIQGVFPNEYEHLIYSEFLDLANQTLELEDIDESEIDLESVSYGQRLGYCRKPQNNTWHYSLSRTWFQLSKRHYGAMIGATIEVIKDKKNDK